MLSQIELEFLKSPERFDANYRRVLRHRIKAKVEELKSELPLLADIIKDCNSVTDFRNGQVSLNKAAFDKSEVLRAGFGPASSARKAGILDRAIFGRASSWLFYRSPLCRSIMQNTSSFE